MSLCTHCGYDLAGLDGPLCPECGVSSDPRAWRPADVMRIGLQLLAAWMVGGAIAEALNNILPLVWPIVRAWPVGWVPDLVVGVPLFVFARPIALRTVQATELGRVECLEIGLRLLGCMWLVDGVRDMVKAVVEQLSGWDSLPLLVGIVRQLSSVAVGVLFLAVAGPVARRLSRWM